ncbi:MAG: CbiX/SirB N-terminal domain-containing protein [Myxococcota bacterium]
MSAEAPERALLLVDHGSRRAASNEMLACVGRMVQLQVGPAVPVVIAHMELAAPTIAEGFAAAVAIGAREIVVVPYLLSKGRHATEDVPRMVAEAAADHPGVRFRVTAPLGVHPGIGEVVLARAGLPVVATLADVAPEGEAGCPGDPARCPQAWCACR